MIGSLLNITIVILATSYLAENTILWIILLLLNIPVYLFFAKSLFQNSKDMIWSLGNILGSETIRATKEEQWAGYHGWVFLAVCLATVTAEYKLIIWVIY